MQKGVNLGTKIAQLKLGRPESHNCETWGVKITWIYMTIFVESGSSKSYLYGVISMDFGY
jgi:hypothetical protein